MAQILTEKRANQTKLTAYTCGETVINVYLYRVLNLLNILNVTSGLPKTSRRQNPITSSRKRIAQYKEDQQTN